MTQVVAISEEQAEDMHKIEQGKNIKQLTKHDEKVQERADRRHSPCGSNDQLLASFQASKRSH